MAQLMSSTTTSTHVLPGASVTSRRQLASVKVVFAVTLDSRLPGDREHAPHRARHSRCRSRQDRSRYRPSPPGTRSRSRARSGRGRSRRRCSSSSPAGRSRHRYRGHRSRCGSSHAAVGSCSNSRLTSVPYEKSMESRAAGVQSVGTLAPKSKIGAGLSRR